MQNELEYKIEAADESGDEVYTGTATLTGAAEQFVELRDTDGATLFVKLIKQGAQQSELQVFENLVANTQVNLSATEAELLLSDDNDTRREIAVYKAQLAVYKMFDAAWRSWLGDVFDADGFSDIANGSDNAKYLATDFCAALLATAFEKDFDWQNKTVGDLAKLVA